MNWKLNLKRVRKDQSHPDKTGHVDTDFKDLSNEFSILIEELRKVKEDDVDIEKDGMGDFFAENNIAKDYI